LLFRIEPAGYMLDLARALRAIWPGEIDVVFMNRALTQKWELDARSFPHEVLPKGRLNAMRAIHRRIRETRPDLLHVAGWSAPPSLAAILIGDACGLPVVVDLDTWRGTPSCWRGAVKSIAYPHLFKMVTHFAPGGNRQAAYLRGFGVPDNKMTAVQMTVDVTSIRQFLASEPTAGATFRERFGIARDATVALFIGRLVSLKGIEDLLVAWPRVTSQVRGMQLVIAGDGELRDRIASAAAVDPSIHQVGRLSGDDVWRAYAAADFVVAPSRFDNWGLVVNEAMAVGAPVIATDIFGCAGDLLRDDTALVVPACAPDRLAESITRLALDPSARRRLVAAASELISEWTIENQAGKIADIWRRAFAAPGPGTSPLT
jgi:glycosyltransferase involved in cell wall biosynthesis